MTPFSFVDSNFPQCIIRYFSGVAYPYAKCMQFKTTWNHRNKQKTLKEWKGWEELDNLWYCVCVCACMHIEKQINFRYLFMDTQKRKKTSNTYQTNLHFTTVTPPWNETSLLLNNWEMASQTYAATVLWKFTCALLSLMLQKVLTIIGYHQ